MKAYEESQGDNRKTGKSDSCSTLSSEQSTSPQGRKWLQTSWDLLLESEDEESATRIPVCYSHLTIGTQFGSKENDINIDEPCMANRQAILKIIDDKLFFNSLSSSFTVLLNGTPCSFSQLQPNDVLQFGSYTVTVLNLPEAVAFVEGYSQPHRRQQWTLSQPRTTIGRAGLRENIVELDDPTVSRTHATIIQAEGHFIIQPDGSRPVWVNGEPVNTMAILGDEDLIQLGAQMLRFRSYRAKGKPRALIPQEATILFSDIWNYTSMAESRPLEETIGQLNEVYKKLGRVIINNRGTLMTYLGDAMMAVFGSDENFEVYSGNHAEQAVRAALEMMEAMSELNKEWNQRRFPQLKLGIGVATGEVMVGDVGVTGHREFAAMGDTTNVASRIEKLTRELGVHLLINEETARQVQSTFHLRELDTVEVKGRRKPVTLFEVLGYR